MVVFMNVGSLVSNSSEKTPGFAGGRAKFDSSVVNFIGIGIGIAIETDQNLDVRTFDPDPDSDPDDCSGTQG